MWGYYKISVFVAGLGVILSFLAMVFLRIELTFLGVLMSDGAAIYSGISYYKKWGSKRSS